MAGGPGNGPGLGGNPFARNDGSGANPFQGRGGGGAAAQGRYEVSNRDLDIFEGRLAEVQDAFSREDYSALRAITTPEMMGYLSEELGRLALLGLKPVSKAIGDFFKTAKFRDGDGNQRGGFDDRDISEERSLHEHSSEPGIGEDDLRHDDAGDEEVDLQEDDGEGCDHGVAQCVPKNDLAER